MSTSRCGPADGLKRWDDDIDTLQGMLDEVTYLRQRVTELVSAVERLSSEGAA